MLCKDNERLIRASRCFVKVTLAWLSKSKSAIIRWVLHRDWHLVMSQCSQDTQALLGQVTGSVTANKPAVLIEAETAGRWSACINFRGVQELAAAIVVTTATVKVSPGRACCHSCHSNVHTGGLTLFFLFFLFSSTWHCYGVFQTAVACGKSSPAFVGVCVSGGESTSGGSWQPLCASSLRWQMCHVVRAATCLAAANRLIAALFVTRLLSLFVFSPLSVRLLTPLIYQFAIASKHPN